MVCIISYGANRLSVLFTVGHVSLFENVSSSIERTYPQRHSRSSPSKIIVSRLFNVIVIVIFKIVYPCHSITVPTEWNDRINAPATPKATNNKFKLHRKCSSCQTITKNYLVNNQLRWVLSWPFTITTVNFAVDLFKRRKTFRFIKTGIKRFPAYSRHFTLSGLYLN